MTKLPKFNTLLKLSEAKKKSKFLAEMPKELRIAIKNLNPS